MEIPGFGDKLVIANCIIGRNLNLSSVRGFARLDLLSDISSADVFDQVNNKFGTQRELKPKHAAEAGEYAVASSKSEPDIDPRAFTEVILNVRDLKAIRIMHEGSQIDFSSLKSNLEGSLVVDVEVDLTELKLPQEEFNPQISRVDGNHRLSAVPPLDQREGVQFPVIPFALFVGLGADQERKIFRDINGNQVKMSTAHLAQIHISLEGDGAILDQKSRSLWLAKKLSSPGYAFQDMVYMGGAKTGLKAALGTIPPINLNSLESMVRETLRGLEGLQLELFSDEEVRSAKEGDEYAFDSLLENANRLATLLNRFWLSIRQEYPDAWQDKKNHILLQSIGLISTSKFASELIRELIADSNISQQAFVLEIKKLVSAGFTYEKKNYEGLAGGAGAQKVFGQLLSKRAEGQDKIGHLLGDL